MTPAEALAALRRVRARIAGGAVTAWDLETLDAAISCLAGDDDPVADPCYMDWQDQCRNPGHDHTAGACTRCRGTGWVCENHPGRPWHELAGGRPCCHGAGAPCPDCSVDRAGAPTP